MIPSPTTANLSSFPNAANRARYVSDRFRDLYGGNCRLYRAPGRVNLIGEPHRLQRRIRHAAAIDFDCWVAASASDGNTFTVHSANLGETRTFDLAHPEPCRDWSDYIQGVPSYCKSQGFECVARTC